MISQTAKSVSTLRTDKPAFYLLIIRSFFNFPSIWLRFFKFESFSFFFFENLKVLLKYVKLLFFNKWGALQQEQGNRYQFLLPVTSVVIFQSKSCHDSIFCWFCRFEISFNSDKKYSSLLLNINTKSCEFSPDSAYS